MPGIQVYKQDKVAVKLSRWTGEIGRANKKAASTAASLYY